jgi:predicted nucleic acid-binding protein
MSQHGVGTIVVVDTDVVSYLFKSHPIAYQYLPDLRDRTAVLSFMTLAELDRWVLDSDWGNERRSRLQQYLKPFVVLPYHRELCAKWAEVTVAAKAAGRRIDCADAWIAATALSARAPLITHNRKHYLGVPGLQLISHAGP